MSEALFALDEVGAPIAAGQWRLANIQLHNWGTIHGYYSLPIPRKGVLITGESGAGKSTILDAIASILTPDQNVKFNAAASGGSGGDSGRDRMSYVRGAYGRSIDEKTGELRTDYLRMQATCSGIGLTFENGLGECWFAGRVFHVPARTQDKAKLSSAFFCREEQTDLAMLMDQVRSGQLRTTIKQVFPDAAIFAKSSQFQGRLLRATGIQNPTTIALLHKTVAAKNVTNLDALMREYMLDPPATFAQAKQAVERFQNLREAHHQVVAAETQINILHPIRGLCDKREKALAALENNARLRALLPVFITAERTELATRELDKEQQALTDVEESLRQNTLATTQCEEQRRAIQRQQDQLGGAALEGLYERQRQAQSRLAAIEANRTRVRATIGTIDSGKVPTSASEMHQLHQALEKEQQALAELKRENLRAREDAAHQRTGFAKEIRACKEEIDSLKLRKSSIPRHLIDVREKLAAALSCDAAAFPFVGELIDIVEPEWEGAAQRLLRSYGQTMLVRDEDASAVARYVNANRLTDRHGGGVYLVYERVPEHPERPSVQLEPQSLVHKLRVQPGVFHEWVSIRLARDFNYRCVAHPDELAKYRYALTREGLIRRGARHEKDDRKNLHERTSWVVGTSNEKRLEAFIARLEAEREKYDAAQQTYEQLQARTDELAREGGKLSELQQLTWEDLDAQTVTADIAQRDAAIAALQRPGSELAHLSEKLSELTDQRDELTSEAATLQQQKGSLTERIEQLRRHIHPVEPQQGEALQPADREALYQICWKERRPTLATIEAWDQRGRDYFERRSAELNGDISECQRKIEKQQGEYMKEWAPYLPSSEPCIDAVADFLDRLKDLETDNLPRFKQDFRKLLAEQAQNEISALSFEIGSAAKKVHERIQPVNASLRSAYYDQERKRYLQIEPRDSKTSNVRKFMAELKAITAGQVNVQGESEQAARERFARIEALMEKLDDTNVKYRLWRQEVLDTRRHVTFRASEIDAEGNEKDHYEGSQGRSGGQSQKLVTFCLAAALRYQLADIGKQTPRYGTIVLDEAFDKTDTHFTRDAIKLFDRFDFQLVLASPMKIHGVVESSIGGVIQVSLDDTNHTRIATATYEDAPSDAAAAATKVAGDEISS